MRLGVITRLGGATLAGAALQAVSWKQRRGEGREGEVDHSLHIAKPPKMRQRLSIILFFFLLLLAVTVQCASPTSFCKCTCFTNSTIIALTDTTGDSNAKKATCNDCNRQFCLDYNLPICKNAKEADVFTNCFQRDSTKDQTIVFTFIFVTLGLLIWAAVKPWADVWIEKFRGRHTYNPVTQQGN